MAQLSRFSKLPLIWFGAGRLSSLPELIKQYGSNVILVTGLKSFMNSVYGQELLNSIKENGIHYRHVIISGEPTPGNIDQAVDDTGKDKADVVISIGGGSVLDAGKAISAMLYKNEPVQDYLEGVGYKKHPGTKIPFIAIPTTSGTGSEATENAVISRIGEKGYKKSLRHENFVPDIALVDPELTLGCPGGITAASGMDCFTQLTEAYLSFKSNEYTDALTLEGLKAVKSSLLAVCRDGTDINARTGMSFAALTSGICLANAGLGVVHGFASSIGGLYDIPHGILCGTLMAPANELTVKKLKKGYGNQEALAKYIQLGELFLDVRGKSEDYYIDGFVGYLHHLTEELQLPGLKKFGIKENDMERICRITDCKNNPVKLDTSDLMEILLERYI